MTVLESIEYDTYRQEKDIERFYVLCPLFLTSTASVSTDAICRYASLGSARYICLTANSICFRFAQTRYDINPRSRSEHIERSGAHCAP